MPIHGYPGNIITANPTAPTVSAASGVWTTEQQLQAISQGNWPGYEYPISRSLRFNSADSAYLNRTPASASNRTTWTWSGWVKQGLLGIDSALFDAANNDQFRFRSDNTFSFSFNNTLALQTTQVFRDTSAWRHFVVVADTTQATSSNRLKIYINGVQITAFSTASYPAQNTEGFINSTNAHSIGRTSGGAYYFNGYMTEVNFIDGQALTPSSFGQNNSQTGIWEPIRYTGTYGTNGFYLNFSDNSNTTAGTLGKDSSGNGNNWTPNNFSVTAGAGNDSLVDTPTSYGTDTGVGGEVRGNYATLNPNDKNSGITLSNGNLDASMPTQVQNVYGTMSVTSGKWYWETTINSLSGRVIIGVGNTVDQNWNLDPSSSSALWGYYSVNGNKLNGSNTAYGNSFTANDVIGVAVDMDSGKIWFSKNGTWQASGDPAAGTNAAFTNLSGSVRPMYDQQLTNAVTLSCNFGQRPFAYTAPSGFKALCTQNLPTPTIGATSTTQAGKYFNPVLYTGTGSSLSVTGVGFQPDFVWIKERAGAADHGLYDAVRGVQKQLESNTTTAETTETTGLTAFGTDGFTVGALAQLNTNTDTYVAWNWKANGAGSSNTAGTITSTVSANTTAGFSIVTYTGTGANATVGHGIGTAPQMIIIKNRQAANSWVVYHVSIGNGNVLLLNSTNASTADSTAWNTTTPTSTVFSLGSGAAADTNQTSGGGQHVAYCFAPVAGYSAFGSYTGNGSTDGPFIFTGFRPRWILIKATGSVTDWNLFDTSRNPYNQPDKALFPNSSSAEQTTSSSAYATPDILSNGFKLRTTSGEGNGNGSTYIYAAFAESPFKYALAR